MTSEDLDPIAATMAEAGDVLVIDVPGRRTGRRIRTPVGYIAEPDGSLLVAASTEYTQWARNLAAAGECIVTIGADQGVYDAIRLPDDERGRVVAGLILRYGSPAERLGAGPAFRLVPRTGGATA